AETCNATSSSPTWPRPQRSNPSSPRGDRTRKERFRPYPNRRGNRSRQSLPQQWTLNRSLRRVTLYRSFVQYTKVESRLQVRNEKSCGLLSSKEAILVVQRVLERTRSPFLAPHQPCPAFFMSLHRLARPLIDNQQRSLKVLLVVLIELRQFKA